jgi:hypothetical protein
MSTAIRPETRNCPPWGHCQKVQAMQALLIKIAIEAAKAAALLLVREAAKKAAKAAFK